MAVDWEEVDRARIATTPRMVVNQAEGDELKLLTYDFTKRFKSMPDHIELCHLTDLQIGAKNFLREKFLKYRKWYLDAPHRYVLLGGDIIDAATQLSVASPYDNTAEPIDQCDEAIELLKPLAEAGRILAYVGGNHERRTVKTFGDSGRLIARELKVPYSRGVQHIDIVYGKHRPFKVSLWHGGGAARTKGAKAQMLHRFMGQMDSQLYLVGHLHDSLMLVDWRQVREDGRIVLKKVCGMMSSSFLGYWSSYAEVYAMSPSATMMGRVILEPSGSWEATMR